MKRWLEKHVPWWRQTLAIVVAVGGIEGLHSGFGMIGRAVDISRLPEIVSEIDQQSKLRDDVILAVVQTNNLEIHGMMTNVTLIKTRQDKVIIFINGLTNHPPIEWPYLHKVRQKEVIADEHSLETP